MRYLLDTTWRRVAADRLLAGSPLRMFSVTHAGGHLLDRIESGASVDDNALTERLVEGGAIHPLPDDAACHYTVSDVTIVTPQLGGTVQTDGRVTVDDGSNPPLAGATLRLADNRGPAAARNAGRLLVDTALVAFVDADVDLDRAGPTASPADGSSWLDALLPHFDDPTVGLVAPRVTGDCRSSLDLGDQPGRIRSGTRVSYVPAAAIVVRATAFDAVGGFDETLRFGEDVDFVWRLDQAGWRCRYEPRSVVWHEPRPTILSRLRQQIGYGSSSAPLAMRHPDGLAPCRTDAAGAGLWPLLVAGHPVAAAAVSLGHIALVRKRLAAVPSLDAARLALLTQLHTGRQLTAAIRRAWWPLALIASLTSKRARWATAVAFAVGARSAAADMAFGSGLWAGMIRKRNWRPIVPRISLR